MNGDFESRVRDIKARAHGRGTPILKALGVDDRILNGKNQPCPMGNCGGTDRFQYTDKFGEGNYHCRSCGAGGGLKLAQHALGMRFSALLGAMERQLGTAAPAAAAASSGPSPEKMKRLCQMIWNEARPVSSGDEVDCYLRSRGLVMGAYPRSLRFHPALGFYEKQPGDQRAKKVADYPAMIALVQGPDDHAVSLHRTYLKDGRKIGDQSKKVLSAGISGAAVRLDEPTDELAITEGIETGLAVRLSTGKPVWSALNCGNMEKLWIPQSVTCVCVYADNDANTEFGGQVSAFTLARRLVREARKTGRKRTVHVFVPKRSGADWADIWLVCLAKESKAA
jgi:putative DNA primase/helicase